MNIKPVAEGLCSEWANGERTTLSELNAGPTSKSGSKFSKACVCPYASLIQNDLLCLHLVRDVTLQGVSG